MAVRKISFDDYQEPTWEEYTGADPRPNQWYTGVLKKASPTVSNNGEEQVQFIFEITEGEFAGWGRALYAPFEGDFKWKMHQTLKALQGGATKDVSLDWDNEKAVANWVKKQKPVRIKTREYNDRILIDKVGPLLELATAPAKREAELPGDTDAGDDEAIEDYTPEELNEMSVEDLVEVLTEEFEFEQGDLPEKGTGRGAAAKYKAALVAAILDEQEAGGDEGDDNQDAVETAAAGEDDDDFDDDFDEDGDDEPEPEPAPRARRGRAAKAAPAPEPAPATRTATRRRRA